jgi:2-enoate reductase
MVGGGLVGCETALWLAMQGKKVTIIEALAEVATDIFRPSRLMLLDLLKANGAEIMTGTCLTEVTNEGVITTDKASLKYNLNCDTVALATGLKPERELYEALRRDIVELYMIGDCKEPRKVINAIWDGYHIASR